MEEVSEEDEEDREGQHGGGGECNGGKELVVREASTGNQGIWYGFLERLDSTGQPPYLLSFSVD